MYRVVQKFLEVVSMQTIDVTAYSSKDAPALYALLADGASWPTWSPIGSFELERPGESEREGVGAIRVFRTGRVASREELVELVPGRRLSYVLLSGLPLRGYRADVDLTPNGASTEIRWRSTFRPKVPGTGWFYRVALTRFIRSCVNGLAAAHQPASRSD
jgi:Polyketide cyclase / dehydrase and lipid transport